MTSPSVAWTYRLGADSTAALVSAIHEGHFRGVPRSGWPVVTAIVGHEWAHTCEPVEAEMLPLLAAHRVRFAQVARGGPLKRDGIRVLDDTRSPSRLHRRGPWTLGDDLQAGGTLPQVARAHKCSMNFMGWTIERFLAGPAPGPTCTSWGTRPASTSGIARRLDEMPWHLYEVRRAVAGQTACSLRILASGNRSEAATALRRQAAARPGCELTARDGIERGRLRHRADSGPSTEWFLVAAPAGAVPKERKNFGVPWDKARAAKGLRAVVNSTAPGNM